MTRENTQSLPPPLQAGGAGSERSALDALGWQAFFARQTDADEMADSPPVRITEMNRKGFRALGDGIDQRLPAGLDATVGDWLLLDRTDPGASRVLQRKSLIKRGAAGSARRMQLVGANIDTAFIVTSCNQDFNVARLERYVALALEAEVAPVIVLTKSDLCETPQAYLDRARTVSDRVPVVVLDARGEEPISKLAAWCQPGRTVAFMGSSGVGKSTLANALSEAQDIETQAIRENDAKGRHTTTRRQLYVVPGGFAVLDTPGMRELQLTGAEAGVEALFSDLHELSGTCRFKDCRHTAEPGCAVLAAVADGSVDAARLERWQKLVAEGRLGAAGPAGRNSNGRFPGKTVRRINSRKDG